MQALLPLTSLAQKQPEPLLQGKKKPHEPAFWFFRQPVTAVWVHGRPLLVALAKA